MQQVANGWIAGWKYLYY